MRSIIAPTSSKTVGIMVCPVAGEPPIPEKSYFRRLSLLGQRLGLVVFVFFPDRIDWGRGRVVGYIYSSAARRWVKGLFPIPDAVYDRCFYSHPETYAAYRSPIRRLMSHSRTRFLGYGLKGKWSVHRMLVRDESVQPYLPDTELLRRPDDIFDWLDSRGELFLKPQAGSHGKGVLHVAVSTAPGAPGYPARGRTARNEPISRTFPTRSRLLSWISRFTAGRKYVIQRYLTLTTAEGEAFDIRVLVQKNGSGQWELTGLAVRNGAPGSVTSNLHGGGHAEEAEPFLRAQYGEKETERIVDEIRRLALRIPLVLEQYHGRLVELGIDIGVDAEGRVWVIEANSKPGRSSFSSLSDGRTAHASVLNPLLYAKYILGGPVGKPGRQRIE